MTFTIEHDQGQFFVRFLDSQGELLFAWQPDADYTLSQMVAYAEHRHTQLMHYSDYRRDHMVYPWT